MKFPTSGRASSRSTRTTLPNNPAHPHCRDMPKRSTGAHSAPAGSLNARRWFLCPSPPRFTREITCFSKIVSASTDFSAPPCYHGNAKQCATGRIFAISSCRPGLVHAWTRHPSFSRERDRIHVSCSNNPALSAGSANLNYNSPAFASKAGLDAAFPQGKYTVNYGGGTEPPGTFVVNDSTEVYATNTPLFTATTFNGLQDLDASKSFTLNWNANLPPEMRTTRSTSCTFMMPRREPSSYYSDGFLGPNVTSVTLPASTLLPDTSYNADLIFSDRIDGPNARCDRKQRQQRLRDQSV